MAGSSDRTIAYTEGATHGFTPCTTCATTPGQFGDTQKETLDFMAQWLNSHFPS